jgi:hypothetical protein
MCDASTEKNVSFVSCRRDDSSSRKLEVVEHNAKLRDERRTFRNERSFDKMDEISEGVLAEDKTNEQSNSSTKLKTV